METITFKIETAPDGTSQIFGQPIMTAYSTNDGYITFPKEELIIIEGDATNFLDKQLQPVNSQSVQEVTNNFVKEQPADEQIQDSSETNVLNLGAELTVAQGRTKIKCELYCSQCDRVVDEDTIVQNAECLECKECATRLQFKCKSCTKRLRLKKGSEMFDSYENSKGSMPKIIENKARLIISEAIMLHNEAFEMINLIEDTNNVGMVGILFQNMVLFGACPFLLSVHLGRPVEFSRYMLMFTSISLHFWVIFTHGQMIIDYSSAIFGACYEFKWYYLSKKSSKLIHIMMTRSVIQSEVTGGKIFILSMETYGQMVKTGLSLFTIFKSLGIA